MTQAGDDIGCKWSGKANQWCMSHHMAGEDLGEGRMHARWATCSVTSREGLEQTTVSARRRGPEGTEPGKATCRDSSQQTEEGRMPLRKQAG